VDEFEGVLFEDGSDARLGAHGAHQFSRANKRNKKAGFVVTVAITSDKGGFGVGKFFTAFTLGNAEIVDVAYGIAHPPLKTPTPGLRAADVAEASSDPLDAVPHGIEGGGAIEPIRLFLQGGPPEHAPLGFYWNAARMSRKGALPRIHGVTNQRHLRVLGGKVEIDTPGHRSVTNPAERMFRFSRGRLPDERDFLSRLHRTMLGHHCIGKRGGFLYHIGFGWRFEFGHE
jgi:hypothetical protein